MGTRHYNRREWLSVSLGGLGALSTAGILRLRAEASGPTPSTSVIFVMLGGGASHFETYDPKPDAPAEYRGMFNPIRTSVPGVQFCELLPRQAALMHDLAVVRSIHHHEASHIALHMVETGYFLRNSTNALRGEMPSVGAVVARARSTEGGLPASISMPRAQAYSGSHYLGGRYTFFPVDADPNAPDFRIGNLSLPLRLAPGAFADRRHLLRELGDSRRLLDLDDQAPAMDAFQRQALELITGDAARTAFDLSREPATLRDAYGRNPLGQRLVLARRLVEAGVPFVMVRTFDWDDHEDLEAGMRRRCPMYDQGLAALITDLRARGMNRDVLIVAMGEFGRTPRVNPQGGRDHWPGVMSVLLSGGSYQMGQAIGASDSRGSRVQSAPYAPQSVLAMMYRHLGIDPATTFLDFTGRPRHVLEEREPIRELL